MNIQQQAYTGLLNVRDFGAKGDGTTDDAAAIQAALDAASHGETVLIPPGEYAIGTRLRVHTGDICLKGRGVLQPVEGFTDFLVEVGRARDDRQNRDLIYSAHYELARVRIESLRIHAKHQCRGLFVCHADHFYFDDVYVEGTLGSAVRCQSVRVGTFNELKIIRCDGNGEALLDLFQRSADPDPSGGTWHMPPGMSDGGNVIRFNALVVSFSVAEVFVDIGAEDLETPFINGNVRGVYINGAQIHTFRPGWSRREAKEKGRSLDPQGESPGHYLWDIYDFEIPEKMVLLRIREAARVVLNQCNIPGGQALPVQLGEPGRPARDCTFVASMIGEEHTTPAILAENAENIQVLGCWFSQNIFGKPMYRRKREEIVQGPCESEVRIDSLPAEQVAGMG